MTEYKIDSYNDSLESTLAIRDLLVGRRVVEVDLSTTNVYDEQKGLIRLDNGVVLEVQGNSGCGGCSEGWYSVTELNTVDNAILNVEFEQRDDAKDEWGYSRDAFRIFVYAENEKIKLLEVTGHDNGYYGTGYWVTVALPEDNPAWGAGVIVEGEVEKI